FEHGKVHTEQDLERAIGEVDVDQLHDGHADPRYPTGSGLPPSHQREAPATPRAMSTSTRPPWSALVERTGAASSGVPAKGAGAAWGEGASGPFDAASGTPVANDPRPVSVVSGVAAAAPVSGSPPVFGVESGVDGLASGVGAGPVMRLSSPGLSNETANGAAPAGGRRTTSRVPGVVWNDAGRDHPNDVPSAEG